MTETGRKILAADDELLIRNMIAAAPGFDIVVSVDGMDALEKISALGIENIEFVITDIEMPNLNGPGLIAKVLEMDPAKKFIVMSGNPEWDEKVIEALSVAKGNATFLNKPFTFEELLSAIKLVRALN